MSWLTDAAPRDGAATLVIEPSVKDLGDFRVRRALPSAARQMVGPFIFLDDFGPARFEPGQGIDVRPHPHIGLATLSYLIEGSILHRDTLGSTQPIHPGDVNWMTAGRGIAHSERTDPASRATARTLQGVQSWIALPRAHEETEPGFTHTAGADLPARAEDGVSLRLIAGEAWGLVSPVRVFSQTLHADVALEAGAALPLPDDHAERAVYVIAGEVLVAGESFGPHRLLLFRPGDRIALRAARPSRVLVVGGEPMDGPRHLWWNFVSSSADRIEQAKADWRAGRFGTVPGDEREYIPLPA